MIPIMMMYKSIGSDSKLLFNERIRIPRPALAPVDSAAISVVKATEAPSLTAVMMKGNVAGAITFKKISLSVAPSTLAALISVSSILITVGDRRLRPDLAAVVGGADGPGG